MPKRSLGRQKQNVPDFICLCVQTSKVDIFFVYPSSSVFSWL